ncbi:MAG: hypothetical protein HYV54_02110 [Parcubacteria group bacterium]|nr:hypothetical protein [Parcubacteria group bacterium]
MTKNKTVRFILIVLILAAISAALQFSTPNIADPDGFYHMAHAKIYAQRGVFYSDFPWTQFSVIKNLKADIWYGFHLFLVPFTFIKDGILGLKLAGAAITFLTLIGFYWVLARLKIKWPALWVIIFVIISPDVMYRLTMTRPHNLSLALVLITFAFMMTRGKKFTFVILGFLSSFLHIALGWLPLFIAAISSLILKTRREPPVWKNLIYLTAGSIIGLAARPHPLGALKLAYIQVIQIIIVKLQGLPLTFGRELRPPTWDMFLRNTRAKKHIFLGAGGLFGIFLYNDVGGSAQLRHFYKFRHYRGGRGSDPIFKQFGTWKKECGLIRIDNCGGSGRAKFHTSL